MRGKSCEYIKKVAPPEWYEWGENIKPVPGKYPWATRTNPENEGWNKLMLAIIGYAFTDYLYEYRNREIVKAREGESSLYWVYNSHCITLENGYFRKNKYLEELFDRLLREICWEGIPAIESAINRIEKDLLRWRGKTLEEG